MIINILQRYMHRDSNIPNTKVLVDELKKEAEWQVHQKQLLGEAIKYYEHKDFDMMSGLCLAAYILSWDDLLERYQEKDAIKDYSEFLYETKND